MIIEERFNGPPGSANGGYSAGLFAGRSTRTDPVEVTLRRPPPLGVPLSRQGNEIRDPQERVVAELRTVEEFTAIVPPVDRATAVAASASYPGHTEHPFPRCYVCGPGNPEGLRIFPGRLPDGRTAAPFRVPPLVGPATVWAALDCPGGWSVLSAGRPYVLGRLAAVVDALPEPGEECVVTGMLIEQAGRKAQVHSTLYGSTGAVLGYARATWIALPPAR